MNELIQRATSSAMYKNNMHKVSKTLKSLILNISIAIILLGIAFVILSPLMGILSNSLMSRGDLYNPLVYMIPKSVYFEHFQFAVKYLDYVKSVSFTLAYTFGITILQILVCSFVGYGFARFRFWGRNIWFGFVVLTIVIPTQTIMVPLYTQFRYFDMFGLFGLFNIEPVNLLGNITPTLMLCITGQGLRSGLYIYIFRQFFRGLPKEIEEAAVIDGAGVLYTYVKVMLPNAVPSIVTVMLFSIVWQYNDVYFAGILMNGVKNLVPMNLAGLGTAYGWGENELDLNVVNSVINAGVLLAIAPIIAIYLFLQKYFMEGIERSGIVG